MGAQIYTKHGLASKSKSNCGIVSAELIAECIASAVVLRVGVGIRGVPSHTRAGCWTD